MIDRLNPENRVLTEDKHGFILSPTTARGEDPLTILWRTFVWQLLVVSL
jgi:hypothetical protein